MPVESTIPFFGRSWSLTITPNQGLSAGTSIVISSSSFEPEALRVTFNVQQMAFSAFWQAEIIVWNANGPISDGPSEGINLYQAVIQEGDIVTLAAGYQFDGAPNIIWTGPIFYTIQDRQDVVDQRLIIHCLLSRALTTQNFINATLPALSTQFTQAQFIAANSTVAINVDSSSLQSNIDSASPQRGAKNLPRGKSFFGNPHHPLRAIADQNGLLSWFDSKTWNTASLAQPTGEVIATYAPLTLLGGPPVVSNGIKLSLIGQPQQTQFGVNFRVLLDNSVQINTPLPKVGLQLQYVRQAPISYPLPEGQLAPRPLQSVYIVVGVGFTGDTRGNPWYTDITAVTLATDVIQLLGQSGQADATNS
jgi:hypothetical protein